MKTFNKNIPYNDLPLLPPRIENIETPKVFKKTIKQVELWLNSTEDLPIYQIQELFLDSIHLKEAKASSEIENIITTNDDLYKSIVADKKFNNPATKEVISYKEALWKGISIIENRPFITTNLCIDIVQLIKKNSSSIRNTPGTVLKNPNGKIIYTPPSGEKIIRDKLSNLETFMNNDKRFDPLIKLALMHYQFEAIHPFTDGNGRTGRILMLLYLKIEKLLETPGIYLSEFIIENKTDYYDKLRLVTEDDNWEAWILYVSKWLSKQQKKDLNALMTLLN